MSGARRTHRLAAGAGLSLGAALGLTATAQAADFTVDRTDDPAGAGGCVLATPNDCSLRQALANAQNANRPTVDRVLFQAGLSGTITLTLAGLYVSDPVDIVGPGANVLSVSGGDGQRVFDTEQATAGDPVTISGLTLTHGNGSGNVGGGAIYSKQTDLTINSSTISESNAGGAPDHPGGGIRQKGGQLLIRSSTISGNRGLNGGGVYASNAAVGVESSTISGNTATGTGGGSGYGYGGGIWLDQGTGSGLIIYSSTIAGNHAHYGGGISAAVAADANGLGSTVVADNTAPGAPDLNSAGGTTFQLAFSLIESTDGATVADVPGFAGTNILGTDPQLAALASNGGPTETQKPSPTSPLLDKGKSLVGFADQRGLARPFDIPSIANNSAGDAADIGAVELQAADFVTPGPPTSPSAPATRKKCKKKHKRSATAAKKCKKKRR
jgi:hypothetical protein